MSILPIDATASLTNFNRMTDMVGVIKATFSVRCMTFMNFSYLCPVHTVTFLFLFHPIPVERGQT